MHLSSPFFKSSWMAFALPLLVILSSVFIIKSGMFWEAPEALAFGITYDLAFTGPLLYLFLIRNKPIPKTTAIPFFIGGLLIASFLLPEAFQFHLDLLKKYLLSAIELGLLLLLVTKTRRTIRSFEESPHQKDFLSNLRFAALKTVDFPLTGHLLASEISLFYYSLLSWKKAPTPNANIYSYHRKSGSPALYGVVILILLVETIALHIILGLWSPIVAWVFTGTSVYAVLQILAHLKACLQRPVRLTENELIVRYGLMGDVEISLSSCNRRCAPVWTRKFYLTSERRKLGFLPLVQERKRQHPHSRAYRRSIHYSPS